MSTAADQDQQREQAARLSPRSWTERGALLAELLWRVEELERRGGISRYYPGVGEGGEGG